jgi:hypothetical protein
MTSSPDKKHPREFVKSMTWQETWQQDYQRTEALPDGRVKDFLRDRLNSLRFIMQILDTLPADDPFRDRMSDLAGVDLEEYADIGVELQHCINVASRKVN